uniref:Predicted protein n=1 Tax=Hordeum vulgare subsp. vulgare TaxID=112509 RepID=F2E605_HORVV|nr:predicted protein [Hordeum vulgare subsp. vulgare]
MRHISADNRFTVEVNPDGGSDDCMDDDHEFIIESKSAFCSRKTTHSTTDANGSNSVIASSIKTDIIDANDSNSVIASSITTDITQDDDENHLELHDSTFIQVPCDQEKTDSVITITHPTKKGQIEMAYVVLSNAVMATVQVKLSPKGVLPPGTIIRVYGKITAQCNRGNIFLLARRQEVGETRVDVLHASDGLINIPIPLARTVFAITIGSPLILEVKLHVECSSYENTISFEDDLHFPIFGELPHHTSKIDGPDMVAQVVITAT